MWGVIVTMIPTAWLEQCRHTCSLPRHHWTQLAQCPARVDVDTIAQVYPRRLPELPDRIMYRPTAFAFGCGRTTPAHGVITPRRSWETSCRIGQKTKGTDTTHYSSTRQGLYKIRHPAAINDVRSNRAVRSSVTFAHPLSLVCP